MENKMKEKAKKRKAGKLYAGIKIVVFFSILLLLVGGVGKVLQRKSSIKKYSDFWKLSKQIDVLFLGSSHMMNGINPLQLYAEYGITGYNMSKSGGIMTESYWMLMNALDYCQPKCVVVDLWSLDRDYQYIDLMEGNRNESELKQSISFLHDNIDCWPLTGTKIATVNDLISDYEIKKEFLWDFTIYHDRWSSINANDFKVAMGEVDENSYLGSVPGYYFDNDFPIYQTEKIEDTLDSNIVCVKYLNKLIEECEKREIEVIFTFLPMAYSFEQDWMAVNTGKMIAEEHDILFMDFLPHDSRNIMDFELDMFDEAHANASGMRKLTSYVGKHLLEVDGVVDHRMDPEYQAWEELVSKWQSEEIQRLLGESNLYLELGMIHDLNASSIIFLPGNSSSLQDDIIQKLIMRLAGSDAVLRAAEQGGPYLLIRDGSSGIMQVQEFAGEQQVDSFATILGDTCYIGMKNFGAVYVDGNFENNYLNMDKYYETQVQIIILGQDGEVMSKLYYNPVWNDMKRE